MQGGHDNPSSLPSARDSPGLGPLPVPGKAPGACQSTSTPSKRQEGEVVEYCLKYTFSFLNAAEERRRHPFSSLQARGQDT